MKQIHRKEKEKWIRKIHLKTFVISFCSHIASFESELQWLI